MSVEDRESTGLGLEFWVFLDVLHEFVVEVFCLRPKSSIIHLL